MIYTPAAALAAVRYVTGEIRTPDIDFQLKICVLEILL